MRSISTKASENDAMHTNSVVSHENRVIRGRQEERELPKRCWNANGAIFPPDIESHIPFATSSTIGPQPCTSLLPSAQTLA